MTMIIIIIGIIIMMMIIIIIIIKTTCLACYKKADKDRHFFNQAPKYVK